MQVEMHLCRFFSHPFYILMILKLPTVHQSYESKEIFTLIPFYVYKETILYRNFYHLIVILVELFV